MPGLIDCSFHACAPTFDMYGLDRMPPTFLAQHAAKSLSHALLRGFTSVRDAGGADVGLAISLGTGARPGSPVVLLGPRDIPNGRAWRHWSGSSARALRLPLFRGDVARGRMVPMKFGGRSARSCASEPL